MWPGSSPSSIVNGAAALTIAAIVIAGLFVARDVLIPLAIAGFLSFALQPLVRGLHKYGLPWGAAVGLVLFLVVGVVGSFTAVFAREVSLFADHLPRYETNLRTKVRDAASLFDGGRLWKNTSTVIEHVEKDISDKEPNSSAAPIEEPIKVEVTDASSGRLSSIYEYLHMTISPLATAGFVLLFTAFILLQYHDLRDRVVRMMGVREIGRSTQALNDAAKGLATFFRLQVALNGSFGVVVGLGLWAIGLPNSLLWGVVAAISRFVPYIGGMIAAAVPLALAAAVAPGWSTFLLTAGLFVVAEFSVAYIAEPFLFGSRTRLSPLAVLLAAAFWTAIWGPFGLILAMPITLALVVFADHIQPLSFLRVLLGNEPVLRPDERLYHLLLAGDSLASAEHMWADLDKGVSRIEYLDSVAFPALNNAASDAARGVLRPDQLSKLKSAIGEYVDLVGDFDELQDDYAERAPKDASAVRALVVPARGIFDETAARLFALAIKPELHVEVDTVIPGGLTGINAVVIEATDDSYDFIALLSLGGASRPQMKLLTRRLTQAFPTTAVGNLVLDGTGNSLGAGIEETASVSLRRSAREIVGEIKAVRGKTRVVEASKDQEANENVMAVVAAV